MPVAIGAANIARAYLGDTEVERIYLGDDLAYQESAAAFPEITALSVSPAHNPLGASVSGALVITAQAQPAGVTLTCVDGNGDAVPATSTGVFTVASVPTSDEDFRVTARNALNEEVTQTAHYRRTTDPSWGTWTWTRIRSTAVGGELVDLYRLVAEVTCHPRPVITVTGDSFFAAREELGGQDLTRRLVAGPGVRGWTLTIPNIRVGRRAGAAFDQTLTLQARNPDTGATADRSQRVQFGGA